MRVAVVDIGTNSTRLLVADVEPDGDGARHASSTAARPSRASARTSTPPAGWRTRPSSRVVAVLTEYRDAIDEPGAERTVAVLTSAVRDAENGAAFLDRVRDDFGLDARTISGDEEARLTFAGATASATRDGPSRSS